MATDAMTSGARSEPAAQRYAPSWLDGAFDAILALPGPTWAAHLLLMIPSALVSNSAIWLSGLRPFGDLLG